MTSKILVTLLLLTSAFAQTLTPNELQHLKLENAQLKARLALSKAQQAAQDYQQAMAAFFDTCEAIRKDNKWPEGTQCNPDSLAVVAPKPAEKK